MMTKLSSADDANLNKQKRINSLNEQQYLFKICNHKIGSLPNENTSDYLIQN